MYKFIEPFGYNVYGKSLGEMWISLVNVVLEHGEDSLDEKHYKYE